MAPKVVSWLKPTTPCFHKHLSPHKTTDTQHNIEQQCIFTSDTDFINNEPCIAKYRHEGDRVMNFEGLDAIYNFGTK